MEKLGMQREGVLSSARPGTHDPIVRKDLVIYAILREEWERIAKERLWEYELEAGRRTLRNRR